MTEVADGAHAPVREGTVGELLERWFDHGEADCMLVSDQDVRTVSGRLGHAEAATTLGVYAFS